MRQYAERFGPVMIVTTLMIAISLFLLAAVYTFRQQEHVNGELCQNVVENREADRVQWLTLERLIRSTLTDADARRRMHELIAGVLSPIPPLECVDNKPVPKEAR